MFYDDCQTPGLPRRAGVLRRSPCVFWTAALAFVGVLGCSHEQPKGPATPVVEKEVKPVEVLLSKAEQTVWPESVRVQGSLAGDEESVVAAKVAGRVSEVLVDLGSVVKKGQTLARLDPQDLDLKILQSKALLAQACAAVGSTPDKPDESLDRMKSPPIVLETALNEEAEANLKRGEQLYERKALSNEELQTRRAAFEVAQARLASALNEVETKIVEIRVRRTELAVAEQMRRDCDIAAPFDGIVEVKSASPGMYLNVGDPTVTLVRTNPLRYRASVPERAAMNVAPGQTVRITLEGGRDAVEAKISRISPALDSGSRALPIEADVPNPNGRLRAGLFAEGQIFVDPDAKTLTIPASAVLEFAGTEKVWRVDAEGNAKEQPVDIGRRTPEMVEILKGLKPGDVVVTTAAEGTPGKVKELKRPTTAEPAPPKPPVVANGQAADALEEVKGNGAG